jgi:hypothetical protein
MIMVFIVPLLLISSIVTSNQTIDLAFAKKHHSDNTGNSGTDTSGSGSSGTNGGINWEDLCNSYHDILGLKASCSTYAHGFELTQTGQTALACLLGGSAGLLIPMDLTTRAIVTGAAHNFCP